MSQSCLEEDDMAGAESGLKGHEHGAEVIKTVQSSSSIVLDEPISCLALFPQLSHMLIVGTYVLESNENSSENPGSAQARKGSLQTFEILDNSFQYHGKIELEYACLDIKFSPTQPEICAVATSTGRVEIFGFEETAPNSITKKDSFVICESSILVLQIAWRAESPAKRSIAAALSDGRVAMLDFEACTRTVSFIQAHSLEVWCVAWDTGQTLDLYSGGDDSSICTNRYARENLDRPVQSDTGDEEDVATSSFAEKNFPLPLFRNSKIHQAGVTAILPLSTTYEGAIVLTGSYDERLRVLRKSDRGMKWEVLLELDLGGGVWRVQALDLGRDKTSPIRQDSTFRVLASCMHAGPRIIELKASKEQAWTSKVIAQFTEHDSMNYASDARSVTSGQSSVLEIISSSFYDRKLCLWHLPEAT